MKFLPFSSQLDTKGNHKLFVDQELDKKIGELASLAMIVTLRPERKKTLRENCFHTGS